MLVLCVLSYSWAMNGEKTINVNNLIRWHSQQEIESKGLLVLYGILVHEFQRATGIIDQEVLAQGNVWGMEFRWNLSKGDKWDLYEKITNMRHLIAQLTLDVENDRKIYLSTLLCLMENFSNNYDLMQAE